MSLLVDIQKDFGKFRLNVSFTAENEVMGLLGASGCGKSMTLKCIAGIVTPDRGKIVADGEVLFDSEKKINLSPQKRHVGLLFQNYALFPNMNVFQNIRTGILREKLDKKAQTMAVEAIMEKLHLTELYHRRPGQLSGGQQQRVALARILVSKPRLLMLDEPLSALDSYLRWEVESELADLLEDYAKTAILVSHDRDEVYRLCHRVCAISEGTSARPVTAREMFTNPQSISAALLSGCKNISAARRLDSHTLLAEDWGISLWSGKEVPENIKGVGIQAADLKVAAQMPSVRGFADADSDFAAAAPSGANEFFCHVERCIEDPMACIFILTPDHGAKTAVKRLRMDMDKAAAKKFAGQEELRISLDQEKLMFFCE